MCEVSRTKHVRMRKYLVIHSNNDVTACGGIGQMMVEGEDNT